MRASRVAVLCALTACACGTTVASEDAMGAAPAPPVLPLAGDADLNWTETTGYEVLPMDTVSQSLPPVLPMAAASESLPPALPIEATSVSLPLVVPLEGEAVLKYLAETTGYDDQAATTRYDDYFQGFDTMPMGAALMPQVLPTGAASVSLPPVSPDGVGAEVGNSGGDGMTTAAGAVPSRSTESAAAATSPAAIPRMPAPSLRGAAALAGEADAALSAPAAPNKAGAPATVAAAPGFASDVAAPGLPAVKCVCSAGVGLKSCGGVFRSLMQCDARCRRLCEAGGLAFAVCTGTNGVEAIKRSESWTDC